MNETLEAPSLHRSSNTTQEDITRALPHAVGPEKSLLSSMMQDPQEYMGLAIEEKLTPEHFYLPNHAILFGFLLELFGSGEEIELVSLVQRLLDRGLLDRVGGPSSLTDIYTYAPSPGHFRHHLEHVKDKFVLRSIIQNSNEAIAQAYDAPHEVAALLDDVERKFMAIREGTANEKPITNRQTIDEVMDSLKGRIEGDTQAQGLMTGFEDLDRYCSGLKPGEMFVIAARPSMGKTSFMMNIAENICIDQGKPTIVFSMEMTRFQIMQRLIFSRARYHDQINRGIKPNAGDLQRIKRAALEINSAKLFIDDSPGITINELRAKARRKKRDHDIQFIAIDYLQLMRSTSKQAQGNREREIAEISAGVKALAKELSIPILILAQLNRGPESRTGKDRGKPRSSDLRESGSVEQDADRIGLLYRPEKYVESDDEIAALKGIARLDLAKNRDGETGVIPLTFIAELMKFETGAPAQEQPDMFAQKAPKSRHED